LRRRADARVHRTKWTTLSSGPLSESGLLSAFHPHDDVAGVVKKCGGDVLRSDVVGAGWGGDEEFQVDLRVKALGVRPKALGFRL